MKQRIVERNSVEQGIVRPKSSPMRRKSYRTDLTEDVCTTSDDSLQRPPRRIERERARPPKSWDDSSEAVTPAQQWAAAEQQGFIGVDSGEVQSDGGRQKPSYKKRRQLLMQAQTGLDRSATPVPGGSQRVPPRAPPELMRCFSEEDRPMAHAIALQHRPTLVDTSSQTTKSNSKLHIKPPHNIFARFGWKVSDRSSTKNSPTNTIQAKTKSEAGSDGKVALGDLVRTNNNSTPTGSNKIFQSKVASIGKGESDEGKGKAKRTVKPKSAQGGLGRISEDSLDGNDCGNCEDNNGQLIPNGEKTHGKSARRGSDRLQHLHRYSKQRYLGSEVGLYATSPSSDEGYKDDDDVISTHSDIPAFRRNDGHRSSLPVVGTPNKSRERPLGLVFLTFRNETKRGLLPNEITAVSTVWALFVRAFSDQLSMEWFEMSNCTVCILDKQSSAYSVLKDLRSIKDRSVLKIFEEGDIIPGMESMQANICLPRELHPTPSIKHQTDLISQNSQRCTSPLLSEHNTGKSSIDRQHQTTYSHQSAYSQPKLPNQDSISNDLSKTQEAESFREASERMCKMETQLASLAAVVQSTVIQQQQKQQQQKQHQPLPQEQLDQLQRSPDLMTGRCRRGSVLSSYSANSDVSQCTVVRQMTPNAERRSTPRPELQIMLQRLLGEVTALKAELARVRQMHQVQAVLHKESIYKTFVKIKEAVDALPSCSGEKSQLDVLEAEKTRYIEEAFAINNALKELEGSVEELRSDVVTRRCDVDLGQVENTTAVLGQVGRLLADHKNKLQILLTKMKSFVSPKENFERLTREEQCEMDKLLDRWKHLAGTLATLKKLAVVQRNTSQCKSAESTYVSVGQKHRSILHKPEQYLPGDSEGETWNDAKPRVPLCPQIYVNDSPISPSKSTTVSSINSPTTRSISPSITRAVSPSAPPTSGTKLKQNVVFQIPSTDTSGDKHSGLEKRITAKSLYNKRPNELQPARNKDDFQNGNSPKIQTFLSDSKPQSLSGSFTEQFQPDNGDESADISSTFYTPKRLPPSPPTRKYLNVCPSSTTSSGSKSSTAPSTPNQLLSDGVDDEENGDDDVFSPNEADFDGIQARNEADREFTQARSDIGREFVTVNNVGNDRDFNRANDVSHALVRPHSVQSSDQSRTTNRGQPKTSPNQFQLRKYQESIESNSPYMVQSIGEMDGRQKTKELSVKMRPSSAGSARTSIPSQISAQRCVQPQSRVPKPVSASSYKKS